jgi:hypothetical protein
MKTHTIADVNFINLSNIVVMSEEYGQNSTYDLNKAVLTGQIKEEHKWRPMFGPLEKLIERIELTDEQWRIVEKIFNLSLHYFIIKAPTLKGTNPTPAQIFINRINSKTATIKFNTNIFERPNEDGTYEDLTIPIIYNYIPMLLYDLRTIEELRFERDKIPQLFHRFISKNITNIIEAMLHRLFKWYRENIHHLYENDRKTLLTYCSEFIEYIKSENFRGLGKVEMLNDLQK